MAISHRFSRLRDRTLRLRLEFSEEHTDVAYAAIGGVRFSKGGEPWRMSTVVDGPKILPTLERVSALGGDYATAAAAAVTAHARLLARAAPVREEHVVDDPALRRLVHAREWPQDALVIDELTIGGGGVRVDVAVLTEGAWTGIELKGAHDSLVRLPRQALAYSAIFDRCEVVTVPCHVAGVLATVPSWWRVSTCSPDGEVTEVRVGEVNPEPTALARAELLWRDEVVVHLKAFGQARGRSKLTRAALQEVLAGLLDPDQMRDLVTADLRSRGDWRSTGPFAGF